MVRKKKITDVVFILDRSGSMHGTEEDTIGGYNNYIKEFKEKDARITTVLFDDNYEILTKREDVSEVKLLTKEKYFVRGSTALLDAIGKSITFMDKEQADKVIFIITTDGYENASREYNKNQIKEMIEGHSNWEFIYIGANIDSYSEGESIGIRKSNIANYVKNEEGVATLFKSALKATECYYSDDSINDSWKEELDEYI